MAPTTFLPPMMLQVLVALSIFIGCSSLDEEVPSTEAPLSSSQLFTFAQPQSYLQLQPEWALPAIREVTFQFRTDRPHGLLLYHGTTTNGSSFPFYELYVMLENGKIKIIHIFHSDGQNETFFIGKGLNRDKWHHVTLRINPSSAHLSVRVDDIEKTESLLSLQHSHSAKYSTIDSIPETVMYFGGLDPNNYATNQRYNYIRFVGCLGNIMFSQSLNPLTPTKVVSSNQLYHNYVDLCQNRSPCLYNGRCINHYTHTSCDCFGTGHEDNICFTSQPTTVSLRGYSYITYRVYDWRDRVHSEVTRLSFSFKTYFENSVLLYASGAHPSSNYVAVSLYKGNLHFEIDFGDGPLNYTIGYSLNDESWHTFILHHRGKHISLKLDNRWHTALTATGSNHHLHLDPEIFIGSAPKNAHGLKSREKFIGCLRNVYFNDKSVLYALHNGDSTARYYSIFSVEYGCESSRVIPMTFPLPESKLVLELPSTKELTLSLEFKTSQANCVLASGEIQTENGNGYWEVLLHNGNAMFVIYSSLDGSESWPLSDGKSGKQLADDQWHKVAVSFDSGEVELEIDYRHKSKAVYPDPIEFSKELIVTTSSVNAERGFIGCIRDIYLAGHWIDPRTVVDTKQVSGKVSLDNCELVNLCNNPHACEHGGRCYVEKGETYCDCTGTGYTGRTCHFSLYKRTCEELYLVGYRNKGVYTIDIDRNGPLPPAHVHCDMDFEKGTIATRVENNMPPEMVVRKAGMQSFYVDVTYREFTPTMLQSLIKHSKQCFQSVKYECFKTPLGLRTYTWMKSSGSDNYITSIGNQADGCTCAETKSCDNSSLLCNCDMADARWRVDEGEYTNPHLLGITKIFILQPENLEPAAEGRLTLGPLECLETDTQEYVITFKTPNSYIEVPGWRRGDIAFSFRTSNSQAVLIYQASIHITHGYLRVLLVNDHELSFEFTVNNKPQSVRVTSRRKLNSGEWQQVWVDHDRYHMRFTVNLDSEMVDYGEAHGVGPFEGPLYVGGVPESDAKNSAIKEGFIGCFRGLVINDAVADLYKHMTRSESAIVLGCQPSCASNPCKNGATCHEYWGSYMCECKNMYAHSGKNCEINVNTNGMTVVTPKSYYHHKTEGSTLHPVLEKNILLSFRTFEKEGLLLYAFDHFNNFVQLHFKNKMVFFTFNSDRSISQISVEVPELSRGFPIQVKVDRQLQQTNLTVKVGFRNSMPSSASVDVKMKFVDRYFRMPWRQGEELENVFPPRGAYRTIDHSEMFLGHVGSGTETNLTSRGFVGCIQGLKIGDDIFDLEAAAQSTNPDEIYGEIKAGCAMLCDQQPCQNDGLCIEHWKDNLTSCDCTLTSYTGELCQKDIGSSFDGKSVLNYLFDDETINTNHVAVRFAFSTDIASPLFQVLLFVQFLESKFILIGITQDSSLFIDENLDSNVIRRVARTNNTWSDGSRHWVYFSKNNDDVTFIVDGKSYNPFMQVIEPLEHSFNGRNIVYISGLPTTIETFGQYVNFSGCISNVMVEFGDVKILPLETAFGYQKGALTKVNVIGLVNERKCAPFALFSQLLAPLPSVVPPEVQGEEWFKEPPVLVPYKSAFSEMSSSSLRDVTRASAKVAAVLGALLIIVILGLLLYIYRIQRRHKHAKLGEDYDVYKGRRRTPSGNKAVSFSPDDDEKVEVFNSEVQPLTWTQIPPTPIAAPFKSSAPEFKRNSLKLPFRNGKANSLLMPNANAMELAPIRSTSSQELEWDPAGAQLVCSTMDHMNPSESSDTDLREAEDLEGPLPNLKSQMAPLATVSEVTINRLSQTFA